MKPRYMFISFIFVLLCTILLCSCGEASKYKTAKEKMKTEDYESAIAIFNEIPFYQDSNNLIEECNELMNTRNIYSEASELFNTKDYLDAADLFDSIADYKDAADLSKECKYQFAYEELEIAGAKMKSGVSDIQAIIEFGERCGLQNYMRLATIIEQNQRRGTKELILALQSEQREALTERKNRAMKKGSEISTKLLGPMVIMLIVTMIIVVVPSFLSMRVK